MERMLAIVNPAAGSGRCGRLAPGAIAALREGGLPLEVVETRRAGEASELVRAAFRDGTRHFVAVGGDGTSFEIVNGLFPEALSARDRPTLGFLPLGTGNSFLRDFSPEGATHAQEALASGKSRPCDVVRLRHKGGETYFINLLSLGFVADVCTVANRRFKRFGELGYGLAVMTEVAGLAARPLPFAVDRGPFDRAPAVFLSISNSRFTGGKMMMAPLADVADGFVDVIVAGELGRFALLRTFPKIFRGTHVEHPAVRASRARTIDFQLDGPLDAMIDGEVLTLWPERLEVLPLALEVRA